MKPSLALKTLYRGPGKTIVTFLLLAALTFSLFLQVAEYQATTREFASNVDMYRGTGYVEKSKAAYSGYGMLRFPYYIATDPRIDASDLPDLSGFDYPSLTGEELTALAALPYISTVEKRYMTAGRSQYARIIDEHNLWDYNARAIVEGTLAEKCSNPVDTQPAYVLKDRTVLAGDMDLEVFSQMETLLWRITMNPLLSEETRDTLMANVPSEDEFTFFTAYPHAHVKLYPVDFLGESFIPEADPNDQNFMARYVDGSAKISHILLKNYGYGTEEQLSWNLGDRFVFVLRFDRRPDFEQGLSAQLYDWSSEHFCPAVWDITDAPENYLELPEYAPLKKLIEITESDLNTLDVVYADDMSAIKLVHEGKIKLTDGRWLTPEDTETKAKVCMLSETFAKTYGLKVGDTLPLELGDKLFEQFYNLGAVASTVERYADTWTDAEFEIVGLYKGKDPFSAAKEPNWSYSVNTVFVPMSSLPETADTDNWELAPGEFTLRVDNAWDIAPFLAETAPQIAAMGLTLSFDDGGWMEVYKPYVEARRISLIRIALLAVVTVMVTAFVVYLFISRKRKDYAIMRALGTPKHRSGAALLLPLMVLAIVSVGAGLAAAAVYIGSIGKLGQPTLGLALLCGLAELLLALLLALAMLHRLSRRSPLALLQGGTRQ